ncbi:DUF2877 domain-containing protein [Yinghuangia seranimata]|uniref:DUF2877 domain-containing protein n=1 Tax=Yinghuangia seranimata TaxID=408067 RepID=UPI00248AC487|nr:DUF2877 domain-containing protein [Yinghuangia seranimata]MDI2124731.1 DUF2877 domain-containing protein [Yinghuangia seranimata]
MAPPTAVRRTPNRGLFPGAASRAVHTVLAGPTRPARVLGVFPAAVYLEADDGTVVAVCAADAVRLPNAVVLTEPRRAAPFAGIGPADPARVGGGTLWIGDTAVRVARWWTPRVPRPPGSVVDLRDALAVCAARTGLPGPGRTALADLARHAARGDTAAAEDAARDLVGLGPGLTPSGDDAVCGVLLALADRPATAPLATRVAGWASGRTTALSAALIGHAARGQGCDEVVDAIDAARGHGAVEPALTRLLEVGHTSGADLALGALTALTAVTASEMRGTRIPLTAVP